MFYRNLRKLIKGSLNIGSEVTGRSLRAPEAPLAPPPPPCPWARSPQDRGPVGLSVRALAVLHSAGAPCPQPCPQPRAEPRPASPAAPVPDLRVGFPARPWVAMDTWLTPAALPASALRGQVPSRPGFTPTELGDEKEEGCR